MSNNPWVIRTNFEDQTLWEDVCAQVAAPQTEHNFLACVKYVDDRRFEAQDVGEVVQSLPDDYSPSFCFLVDDTTLISAARLILVVSFHPEWDDAKDGFDWQPPRLVQPDHIKQFRAIPAAIQSIENNLSLANMDFDEFAEAVDIDGVFRGFGRGTLDR